MPMIEQEWLACSEPQRMLGYLRRTGWNDRKLRLFTSLLLRRVTAQWRETGIVRAIDANECYADREMSWPDCSAILTSAEPIGSYDQKFLWDSLRNPFALQFAFHELKHKHYQRGEVWSSVACAVCDYLRDMFANPFRPNSLHSVWRSGTVVSIAQAIYDERAFERMPILGDALEDAGCDNGDVLNHCRQPGVHVRGCWVVDLLLGKE